MTKVQFSQFVILTKWKQLAIHHHYAGTALYNFTTPCVYNLIEILLLVYFHPLKFAEKYKQLKRMNVHTKSMVFITDEFLSEHAL